SEALHSTDESVRRFALFTLDALGPVAEPLKRVNSVDYLEEYSAPQLPSSGSDETSASGPEVYRRAEARDREQLLERPPEAGHVLSDLIEVCVLSEFALQPRSGMRLRDSALDTERKGGAFKIPMGVLLGPAGVDLPVEPTGTVSVIASEDSE